MNGEIVTLRNKNTGEIIKLRRKTPEQPTGEIATPQTFRQQQIERQIAQRPDIYQQAAEETQRYFQKGRALPSLQDITSAINIPLKSIGGLAQRTEATIAAPFYEMPRGIPAMAKGIKQAITGEKKYELGDIARQAGLPEPISAGLGLLGTGIIGGAIAKGVGLEQQANNLTKLETTYGKDISKNIIKQGGGLSDEAVEHGMAKGWKNILTKENLKPEIKYNLVLRAKKGLQNFYRAINRKYGMDLDKVAEGVDLDLPLENIKISITNKLRNIGVLDDAENILRNPIDKVEREIFEVYNNLKTAPQGIVKLKDILLLKRRLWNEVSKATLQGNQPITSSERLVYELQDDIYNALNFASEKLPSDKNILTLKQLNRWYAPLRNFFNDANRYFKVFKEDYATDTGERLLARYFKGKTFGEKNLIEEVNNIILPKYKFLDELKNWLTTQEFLIKPSSQGVSLYPFRLIAESGKYGLRQALKTGIPSLIGRETGQMANVINPYIIPPSILRMITGRNERTEKAK